MYVCGNPLLSVARLILRRLLAESSTSIRQSGHLSTSASHLRARAHTHPVLCHPLQGLSTGQ